ncbi:MAG: MBL fold metallo-hydrolase [Deltaproteobacteria bacterium]|nr:MBL fold metallo-hydrolase [Deltaproteobacteria bacterium]
MSIEDEVDRLIDERPGRELLHPDYDEKAVAMGDFIFRSAGTTASYMVVSGRERVIVNTGMGWEAPHHKHLFDAVHPGPTPYIITTQGHVDHVGGVSLFREPGTRYVAQANNATCQADDARLPGFRGRTAMTWFPDLLRQIGEFGERYPGEAKGQDRPTPDLCFEERVSLRVGELEIELLAMPGGETIDSLAVWLPQHRIAILSNLFGPLFPHFPNFNTLRGDKYRFPVPYMENAQRVRALQAELLITGRGMPIEGRELIDASLRRLHDAVDHVHRQTLAGMNAGKDLYTIMRETGLPPELRVGQGYGKIEWAARTIWESTTGWFQRRSTADLYGVDPIVAHAELAGLAGADRVLERARALLAEGDAPTCIRLAEAALAAQPDGREAAGVLAAAHRALLESGGDVSFWENGWLEAEAERWRGLSEQ